VRTDALVVVVRVDCSQLANCRFSAWSPYDRCFEWLDAVKCR
jgi:hypothetical protein